MKPPVCIFKTMNMFCDNDYVLQPIVYVIIVYCICYCVAY